MSWSFTLLLAAFPAYLSFTAASTVGSAFHPPILQGRQAINCSDQHAVRSASCWDQLNVANYLTNWKTNTPTCTNGQSAQACCEPNEPWSTCFLRLATGNPGTDCTTLSANMCTNVQVATSTLSPEIVEQVSYVVSTILAINELFLQYANAWTNAKNTPGHYDNLYEILYNDVVVNNGNLKKAVTASLPFWGTPYVIAGGPQNSIDTAEFYAQAQTFATSVLQTPWMTTTWWGPGFDANDIAYANTTQLPDLVSMLDTALLLLMSDAAAFNSFAAHGAYSAPQTSAWSGSHGGLLAPITTYVVSEALSQNTFSAKPLATSTKEGFQSGKTCTTAGDICKDGSSNVYYWSSVTQMQYQMSGTGNYVSLLSKDSPTQLQNYEGEADTFALMKYIEERTATYMPVLFDGSYNCTLEGKAGGSAVNLNTDGSLDISCLSALPIYLSKGTACPQGAVYVGGKCPFGYYG